MKHGSIVWYNDGTHSRRFLFVTFLDNGTRAHILDLDSGELIPRVVDTAALTLDDTDNGPDKICAALDKLTAATEAQTRTVQDCNAAALDALKTSPLSTSPNPESELLAYLKLQQEVQTKMVSLLLDAAHYSLSSILTALDRIERRREKNKRKIRQWELEVDENKHFGAQAQDLQRDIANQGKALGELRAEINKLRDEIKGDDDGPPARFLDLSSRLSEIENR